MRTFIFLPPLRKMSGGLRVLLRLGNTLHRAGHDVAFVAREQAPWLEEGGEGRVLAPGVPLYWWPNDKQDQLPSLPSPLTPDDLWLVPEGWPHALLPGMKAGARVVVYVQNWAYLLSEWPENLAPDKLPVHYMAVSHPVAWYIRHITGKDAAILPAAIDSNLFTSCGREPNFVQGASSSNTGGIARNKENIRIAWMPRKNKAQARHIQEIVNARRSHQRLSPLEWVEIHGKTPAEVAQTLRACHLYLATGFPEGFSLPPLEAMACGCACAGFSGFGGFEYMRAVPVSSRAYTGGASSVEDSPKDIASAQSFGTGLLPAWLPAEFIRNGRSEHRPGNGIWVSDGDILGAALAIEQALQWRTDNAPQWEAMLEGGRATSALYGLDFAEKRALEIWSAAQTKSLFA